MSGPRVFISYCRDSAEHFNAVLRLAQRLRGDGVDMWFDGFERAPPVGAARWLTAQLTEVDFVLVVCTAGYRRRFDGKEQVGVGPDETFEGLLLSQQLWEGGGRNRRVVPVLFPGAGVEDVPQILRPFACHALPADYEPLLRHLTAQPEVVPAALGPASGVRLYLEWMATQSTGLDLIGVGGGDVHLKLEEVYVPLRVAGHGDPQQYNGKDPARRSEYDEDFELTELFTRLHGRPHALLLGAPGSGKTTALRKLALQCRGEGPGSLQLLAGYVPVFVRLRRFRAADLGGALSAFVQRELRELSAEAPLSDATLTALWSHGQVLLLLDGLDEIADEAQRAALCGYLAMQLDRNENARLRVVVSSRFAGHDGVRVCLDNRFGRCELRPLNAGQVGQLVHRWFMEASTCLPSFPLEEARRQAEKLATALVDPRFGQRMQVMFSTPLQLTLLCVVVQQGREMPDNRSAFYEECLRVLLLRWRKAKGFEPLLAVDTALAVLRPLAYALHRAGQREEVSEDDIVEHLYRRLAELGRRDSDPGAVLEWLHRDTGVLTEFALGQYGFFHLGIQEYLAALHIASGDEALLATLAGEFDRKWWHEVARLLVSMPSRNMFGPLMRRLLAGPALLQQTEVLRACVLEAAELDVGPFIERFERKPPETPERQVELLRLLLGRSEPALLECATRLIQTSRDADVRAMADRVLASATRATGAAASYDVVLIAAVADMPLASLLAASLRANGLRVWPGEGRIEPASALRWLQVKAARVAVVLVGAADPWPDKQAMIRMFRDSRQVVGVRLPGASVAPGEMDGAVPSSSWIDLRGGVHAAGLSKLCRRILPALANEPKAGELWVEPVTGLRFVYVSKGRFKMGADNLTAAARPSHWVRLSAFWFGETPVTNGHYAQFMAATRHREPALWRNERFSDPSQPVVGVDWDDARAFCAWLSEAAGVEAKLPSEVQWEYAARGTDGRVYPWGNEAPGRSRACFDASRVTAPPTVGSYPGGRGPFGAMDQAGTVWEWCEDVWNAEIYATRVADEPLDPRTTVGDPDRRVLRGGSWANSEGALAAADRGGGRSTYRVGLSGFRVVVSASRLDP